MPTIRFVPARMLQHTQEQRERAKKHQPSMCETTHYCVIHAIRLDECIVKNVLCRNPFLSLILTRSTCTALFWRFSTRSHHYKHNQMFLIYSANVERKTTTTQEYITTTSLMSPSSSCSICLHSSTSCLSLCVCTIIFVFVYCSID